MSYRKLTRRLIAACTMVLAFAWMSSMRTWRDWTATARPFTFSVSLRHGTVGLFLATDGASGYHFSSTSFPSTALKEETRTAYPATGRFGMTSYPLSLGGSTGRGYQLEFPLWLPCLILTGAAFALVKYAERRATAATEREQAVKQSGGEAARLMN